MSCSSILISLFSYEEQNYKYYFFSVEMWCKFTSECHQDLPVEGYGSPEWQCYKTNLSQFLQAVF